MSRAAARNVARHADANGTASGKCMKVFALNAAASLAFLSFPEMTGRFTVATVSQTAAASSTKQPRYLSRAVKEAQDEQDSLATLGGAR